MENLNEMSLPELKEFLAEKFKKVDVDSKRIDLIERKLENIKNAFNLLSGDVEHVKKSKD